MTAVDTGPARSVDHDGPTDPGRGVHGREPRVPRARVHNLRMALRIVMNAIDDPHSLGPDRYGIRRANDLVFPEHIEAEKPYLRIMSAAIPPFPTHWLREMACTGRSLAQVAGTRSKAAAPESRRCPWRRRGDWRGSEYGASELASGRHGHRICLASGALAPRGPATLPPLASPDCWASATDTPLRFLWGSCGVLVGFSWGRMPPGASFDCECRGQSGG
jgi:hypothetical protein